MSARHAGLLGVLAALWGSSYLLIKYALAGFSPLEVVFGRATLAAIVLLLACRLQGGAAWTALAGARRRPGPALALGALSVAVPFTLISVGELEVPSGLTAILIAPSPLWVAVLAPLLDPSEALASRGWLGLAAGLGGIALVVGVETIHTTAQFLAALGILAAAACYAGGSYLVKGAYRGDPSLATSAIAVSVAAVLTAAPAAATAPTGGPGAGALAALLALGVTHTALAFVIFYKLIGEIGAGRANLVSYLTPAVALAYGALLRSEPVTPVDVLGLLLILGGVALASRAARAPAPVSP